MSALLLALSLLKVGVYAPGDGAAGIWPYAAVGIHQPHRSRPWGAELGYTQEPRRHDAVILGRPGYITDYRSTYLFGLTRALTPHDLDLGVGGKVRDGEWGGYVGITFRFSALRSK